MVTRDPVRKAFDMLSHMLDSGEQRWSVRRLAADFHLPASTVHRTVSALADLGILRQDPDSQLYELGDELHRLARQATDAFPLTTIARPHLQALTDETGETTLLGVPSDGDRMMFALQVEGTHQLRYVVPLHTWVPIHLGASGLALLAFLPEARRERVLESLDDPQVGADELREEIEATRRRGYAISSGQRIPGAIGIAAPLLGSREQVIADVVLTIPDARYDSAEEERYGGLVCRCAEHLSRALGG